MRRCSPVTRSRNDARNRRSTDRARSREQHVKVYEVYPPLPGEEPYRRLIEEDGRPVPADKLEKQDRERQKKVEEYARELANRTPSGAARRRSASTEGDARARRRHRRHLQRLRRPHDWRARSIDGHRHDRVRADATSRTPNRAHATAARSCSTSHARAWISESEYELVKVDVEAVDTDLVRTRPAGATAARRYGVVSAAQGERRSVAAGEGDLHRRAGDCCS